MIQVGCVIYKNYKLYDLQIEHWSRLNVSNVEVLYVDNTPELYRGSGITKLNQTSTFDGQTHGEALDWIAKEAITDIIGFVDSDFFWLDPNLFSWVENKFKEGYKCIGCAGFYPDWQHKLDPRHPGRAGHLAPVCWGMFVDRKLALEQTFAVTPEEGFQIMETGWRLRKRIIEERIPCIVFPGFSDIQDPDLCYFGEKLNPLGVHFLKGSGGRSHLIDYFKTKLNLVEK